MFELIKFMAIVGVPVLLIYTRRHTLALLWLGATVPVDALSATAVVRVATHAGFGLATAPFVLYELSKRWRRLTKVEVLILASCLLTVVGMVIYGWLYPWPDLTHERPLNQAAQGRSLIFTVRYLSEMCLALYIGYAVRRIGKAPKLMHYLLIGTTISAAGILIQLVTGLDLFHHLSAFAPVDISDMGRARGLNYEPRGAAQWAVIGILLCIGLSGLGKIRWPLVFFHLLALAGTLSTSGLMLLGICLTVLAAMARSARKAWLAMAVMFGMVFVIANTVPALKAYVDTYNAFVETRLRIEGKGESDGLFEKVRNRLEVFDAAAVSFYAANPEFLVFGTGPGVISIPSSSYLRPIDQAIWGDRIDSIPHGGLVQILANAGIVGVLLWLLLLGKCREALMCIVRRTQDIRWRENYVFFIVFSLYYALMIREMWFLSLGMAVGAAVICQEKPREEPAT